MQTAKLACISLLALALNAADAYTVTKITDGDTLRALPAGTNSAKPKEIKVRLHCIDAPEAKQDYGRQATAALSRLAEGKAITLDIKERDKYGREIAVVWDGDLEINLELVRQGYAWHFARYCDDIRYYRAQKEAENAKLGLWGAANPIEPSEFRRLERKK